MRSYIIDRTEIKIRMSSQMSNKRRKNNYVNKASMT